MSLDSQRQRLDLEAKAIASEKHIDGQKGTHVSIEAAISAAELYLQALKLAENPVDKQRLHAKAKAVISTAEELKKGNDGLGRSRSSRTSRSRIEHPTSTRKLTTRENIILLQGSKLNGAVFKPWTTPPVDEDFELQNGQELWTDEFAFSLSDTQLKHFAGWKRPNEALPVARITNHGQLLPSEATVHEQQSWDMVQDVAPDCSVVASFCVGAARAEKGHKKIFSSIIYPYDHHAEQPLLSPNGRYVLRLYFNGCWRRVEVDDRLPASKSTRVLHVLDRSHPDLAWPAIAEKAYMKVRGGYNFPGSNSSTDLAVLIGWIPQQIFLHDEDLETENLWAELYSAFLSGEIMCTLGTGRLSRREQQKLGLGAEHDYAILEIRETDGTREMLIKNPWAGGDIWKGATKGRPHPGHENDVPPPSICDADAEDMKPGTFWMDFNCVFQYFDNLYVNWDPGLFRYREDMHFDWNLPDVLSVGNVFVDHPQFAVQASQNGEVWVLLNRHFRTGDFSLENHGKNGYISLYLFENNGDRVFSSDGPRIRGPFVDSPNTLLRFPAQANQAYSIVVVSQDLPSGKHSFTISAFSNGGVTLSDAHHIYKDPQTVNASWTRSTSGGSSDCPRYLQNPQFSITAGSTARSALVLKAFSGGSDSKLNADVHVKILVVRSDGRRITKLRHRDIIAHSGDYKRASTVIETTLSAGTYSVICSTFEQNQLSKFELSLYTALENNHSQIQALPAEGSGRFSVMARPAAFTDAVTRLVAPLGTERLTKALFKATSAFGSDASMFRMSLEQGQGPYKIPLASSASESEDFSPIAAGLRIEDVDLNARMSSTQRGGLWLVLEKPGRASTQSTETTVVQVEVLCDEKIEIGDWVPLDE